MSAENKKSYGTAVRELKEIVDELRDHTEDIDVDDLLSKVKNAKELIGICEDKLQKAEIEISQVLKDIRKNDGEGRGRSREKDFEKS